MQDQRQRVKEAKQEHERRVQEAAEREAKLKNKLKWLQVYDNNQATIKRMMKSKNIEI